MIDLRPPTEEDFARFKWCLAQDEAHKEQDADDWKAAPGELMTFYDHRGNRVWVRIERVMRISIQHDPETPVSALSRILYKGFFWLKSEARSKGFTEVIFESRATRLIHFLTNLFGFERARNTYYVRTIG